MMKIVAGMGSIDDYIELVGAGADEVFVGYVPEEWQITYGLTTPLNRREVCYYNVQVGSRSEMEILSNLVKKYGVPVTIAVNGLHYTPQQYLLIEKIIRDCMELGFYSFIVADFALLVYLNRAELNKKLDIHMSGEFGEVNHLIMRELSSLGMNRMIFHRKVSLADMEQMILKEQASGYEHMSYEAFLLNEKCHFHGGFCDSLHCDEMEPICRLDYQVRNELPDGKFREIEMDNEAENVLTCGGIGLTGCALCQLWKMEEIGITHLKIVGRGGYSDDMIRDVREVKKALNALEYCKESLTEAEFQKQIQQNYCNGNCYYGVRDNYIKRTNL